MVCRSSPRFSSNMNIHRHISPPWEIRPQSVAHHLRLHVVRRSELGRLGTTGRRVPRAYQAGVRSIVIGAWLISHLCYSYDAGINTFDTANVGFSRSYFRHFLDVVQMYSFGESERILGKAIKKYNLPREEIVVLTKLYFSPARLDYGGDEEFKAANAGAHRPEMGRFPAASIGFVNRSGLSRKVSISLFDGGFY